MLCLSASAQVPQVAGPNSQQATTYGGNFLNYADLALFNKKTVKSVDENAHHDVEGSPFLDEKFIVGTLVTIDDDIILEVPLKINFYTHDIIAKNVSGDPMLLNESQYKAIILPMDGKKVVFKRVNEESPKVFYEVLFENSELVFYKEHFVAVKEGANYGLATADKRFSNQTRYFIKRADRQPEKIRLKKKNVFTIFPGSRAKELYDYAEAQGLELKSEEDYVQLFTGVFKGL